MKEGERVAIGTRVYYHSYGEGTIIGVYYRDRRSHLIQFDRNLGLHSGCGNAVDASGEKVVGKDGHCYFMRSHDFTLVEDFDGNP